MDGDEEYVCRSTHLLPQLLFDLKMFDLSSSSLIGMDFLTIHAANYAWVCAVNVLHRLLHNRQL